MDCIVVIQKIDGSATNIYKRFKNDRPTYDDIRSILNVYKGSAILNVIPLFSDRDK